MSAGRIGKPVQPGSGREAGTDGGVLCSHDIAHAGVRVVRPVDKPRLAVVTVVVVGRPRLLPPLRKGTLAFVAVL